MIHGSEPGNPAHVASELLVDRLCDDFEHAWKKGHGPRIEDWLVQVTERERTALRLELIAVEIELRYAKQESVDRGEYDQRFPEHRGVGSSRVDLQACKLEYSIVSPK